MAQAQPPQYFPNDLQPTRIEAATLKVVLTELRSAINRSIDLIRTNYKPPHADKSEAFGTISYGALGIALMFLRLDLQAKYIHDGDDPSLWDSYRSAYEYMNRNPVKLQLAPGRPTPLCHPFLGTIVLRILAALRETSFSDEQVRGLHTHIREDIAALYEAVEIAIHQPPTEERHGHSMGGDEVLLGRAGLLWVLLNIRRQIYGEDITAALKPVIELIPKLVSAIIEAGKLGAAEYVKKHGEMGGFPLMWPWLDHYYGLGAMHGITGILTVLLSCHTSELIDHLPLIAQTITAICHLSISNAGHLPMSIPPYPSSAARSSPLVQICHGAPGLLLLLGATRNHGQLKAYRAPEWDEAVRLSTKRVWDEGLLSKGGGTCHGIAGNAWPWLILAGAELGKLSQESGEVPAIEESSTAQPHERLLADDFLSRALPFLLHARETPPFKPESESQYRMPDNPYSLFEGLAGTVCAWSEACVLINARLRLMEMDQLGSEGPGRITDERYGSCLADLQGFPGLGGCGAFGLL